MSYRVRGIDGRVLSALIFSCVALPAVGQGQEEHRQDGTPQAEPQRLEEISVSGEWLGPPTESSVATYPGARSIVTEQELQETGARNVEDALRDVPGVRVQDETGTGILPNIGVRGLNPLRSGQTLLLEDGIPLALAPYGAVGVSLFPVTQQTVQTIDVARGGVAVRYGPNNVGGLINFITRPIATTPEVGLKESLTIADNGNLLTDSYARVGGFINDSFGLQLQANRVDGETFRDGRSDTRAENLILDADWFLSDDIELKGRLQYYKTESQLAGALSPDAYREDRDQSRRPFDRFDADTVRGSLVYNQVFDNNSEFNWSNFAHRSDRSFTFGVPLQAGEQADRIFESPRHFDVFGTEPRYTFTLGRTIPQKITFGARYVREDSQQDVNSRDLGTSERSVIRDFDFDTNAYAIYVSDTVSLLNGRLKVTPGLRYEDVSQDFVDQQNGTRTGNDTEDFLPGIDIGYQWTDGLFVFANVHRSLRPVQFVQITRGGDIESERATNYEIGARLKPVSTVDAALTYFRLDFEDQIAFDATAGRFNNLGESLHQGIEAQAQWRPAEINDLSLNASYTYLDTEQRAGEFAGNELPFASEHQVSLGARYRVGPLSLNLNGLYVSPAFTDAANTRDEGASGTVGEIPAYWLVDAQATVALRWQKTPVKLSLGINNLLDEDYYFRGVDFSFGRLPAPGRAVITSLEINFGG